jgi:hypothetical protein
MAAKLEIVFEILLLIYISGTFFVRFVHIIDSRQRGSGFCDWKTLVGRSWK